MLGLSPRDPALLARVGFVGQEHPLHGGFTFAETMKLGRKLNPGWDVALAHEPCSASTCRSAGSRAASARRSR